MRPLRLTMQAFGPYRDQETVDFTELGPNRVFLIHGDTGSGKTTILDAMVFALYDDTSGGERRASQMRCESAPDTFATEVTFDFSLGAKSYRVRRRPAQELTGARGSVVVKPAEAALWDRSGCSDGQEGKLLTTKITETNTLIKQHLGFSCEQFRQVVVLPQGRFRELLSATSDKREEILRQLFKTARFRQLEDALADRAKTVRRQMDELRAQRDAQLGLVDAADDAQLSVLVEAAVSQSRSASAQILAAEAASSAADEELAVAEKADEARKALEGARAELQRLAARANEIDVMRSTLEDALRADKVHPAFVRLEEAKRRTAAATRVRSDSEQALADARSVESAASEAWSIEEGRATARDDATQTVIRLQGLFVALEAWRTAKTELDAVRARSVSIRGKEEIAAEAQACAERRVDELRQQLTAARTAAIEVDGARVRLETAKLHEDRCRRLIAAQDVVEAAEERHMRLLAAEADALEAVRESDSELAAVEDRWRAGRAVALAATLEPGAPCPVCGATDHPAPARAGHSEVYDDELAAVRAIAESARAAYADVHDAVARAKSDLVVAQTEERSIRQEPGAIADLQLPHATDAVAACVAELERLSGQAHVDDLETMLTTAEQAAEAARTAAKAVSETLREEERSLAAAEERVRERAQSVPEQLREAGELDRTMREAQHAKKTLDGELAAAQRALYEARENRARLESAATSAAEAERGATCEEAVSLESLTSALKRYGFAGEEDWRESLMPEVEQARLQAELQAHGDAVQQATGRLHQAELAAVGLAESSDIEALRGAADAARAAHTAAISRQADARGAVERLAKVTQSLADIDALSEHVRRAYETVGVLADVAGGGNSNRVSFQRWVLGVYLDEVLLVASRRLFAMSDGRYQLQRQRDVAGRGRASGLDLSVFDEYSGTTRPAVTLSGGESFLAALALALGLAETVQEHAAGVPLETIFVDEGFGALDSDSLELAIDALMDLQQGGRLVGVISHVPELRQVIPARLEVRGGSGGSSTRFVVP